jgi:flagellar biosynthetic protein FlhB
MARDNKTERATPRRRQRAREKGQVARSRELMASTAGFVATLVLAFELPQFPHAWRLFLRSLLDQAANRSLRMESAPPFLAYSGVFLATAAALSFGWMTAVGSAVAQGGLVFAPQSLMPLGSRLNPAARLRQLFSVSALRGLAKSLIPAAAIAYFASSCLARDWSALMTLPGRNTQTILAQAMLRLFEVAWKSALVLLLWAVLDYLFERRHFENELRMSRQEVLDEFKETEGNPAIKARIRRLQRQARRRRMLEDTKRASVVITNPSEYAIALEYGPHLMAPVVVAKGRNLLANEIKEIARWQGIPLIENPPLAHVLYRTVEVGQSIPPKLYAVIAEVLAAIYRAQTRALVEGGN